MATLVLIADIDAGDPLLRDGISTAVVLEGWAFNPAGIDDAVRAVFADGGPRVRTFHEIEHVVISGEKERGVS
jgi:hypothetical protein